VKAIACLTNVFAFRLLQGPEANACRTRLATQCIIECFGHNAPKASGCCAELVLTTFRSYLSPPVQDSWARRSKSASRHLTEDPCLPENICCLHHIYLQSRPPSHP